MMPKVSVVTPTLGRPEQLEGLAENLSRQLLKPVEWIVIDGAPPEDRRSEDLLASALSAPFGVTHVRHGGGTAVQRNVGIDRAVGDYVALIDDDIRLEPDFLQLMVGVFVDDRDREIGGQAGYIENQYLDPNTSRRWQWYKRLRLFTTYEPGKYDFTVGYPINRYMQPPHEGLREIDFMGAGCAVWRSEVFGDGLRFDEFFSGFGVLEDAHLALRAGRQWKLVENGLARCRHLKAESSRESDFDIARKTAVNYRYVFVDIVPERSFTQEARFWSVQLFDLLRFAVSVLRRRDRGCLGLVMGKIVGICEASRITRKQRT